jgi:chromosome segregation ATPase
MTKVKSFINYISEQQSSLTLEEALKKIDELEETIGYLKKEKKEIEDDKNSFWDEIESLRSDKEDLESELDDLKDLEFKLGKLSDDYEELKEESNSLKYDYENLEGLLEEKLNIYEGWRHLITNPENRSDVLKFTEHLEDILKVFKENPIEIGRYLKEQDRDPIIDYVIKPEILDSISGKGGDMLRKFLKK